MAKPKENIPTLTLTPLNFKEGKLKSNPQEKPMDVGDDVSKYDPTIYCRTCANADPCLVPIFKEEGLDYKLDKKIEKYLPIRVSEKDDLSVHICYHCASTLIAWDSLIEGCVQAEKKLTSLKNTFKSKESEEVEEGGELVIDEIDSDDEPLITKKSAPEKAGVGEKRDILQEKNDFQGLLEPVNAEPQRLVEEPDLSFSNYQHQFSVYRLLYLEIFSVRIESIFCCDVCSVLEKLKMRVIKSLTSLNDKKVDKGSVEKRSEPAKESLELVTEQVLLVEDRLETVKNGLEPDKEQLEPGKENLEVFVPPFELFKERLELMKKHLKLRRKRLQPKVKMTCELCGKVLFNRRTWKSHLRAHSIKKQCHQCGKIFNCSFNLSRHMKVVHEGLKEHQCKYCGRRYRTRNEMEDHEMVHKRSVEKIVCEDCGWMCVNKSSFYSHKKLHRGTKPSVEKSLFCCEECHKTFTTKKSKVEHMLIHTGEKPMNCSYCNKNFRTKKAIEQHMPIHTGEKPFVCQECGKAFKRKDHLRVHVRSHTGEKPYTCEYCGKGTTQLTDMKKHIKTHVKPV